MRRRKLLRVASLLAGVLVALSGAAASGQGKSVPLDKLAEALREGEPAFTAWELNWWARQLTTKVKPKELSSIKLDQAFHQSESLIQLILVPTTGLSKPSFTTSPTPGYLGYLINNLASVVAPGNQIRCYRRQEQGFTVMNRTQDYNHAF